MFFEGKMKLSGADEATAVFQCEQRASAFMEETKYDHLATTTPRNVIWAAFFDEENIGFLCRRRNLETAFPFQIDASQNNLLTVVFKQQRFHDGNSLLAGGKFLHQLFRHASVLGYEGLTSQPTVSISSKTATLAWRSMGATVRGAGHAFIVFTSQARNSLSLTGPTHAIKLFTDSKPKDRERVDCLQQSGGLCSHCLSRGQKSGKLGCRCGESWFRYLSFWYSPV
eukprot:Lithocolla_globosa_v1_NODE_95_length_6502_cov_31.661238.p3 type:complete len:226 gc:universal NODE_95_length_6502_cov_31.661238:3452-4129(+)